MSESDASGHVHSSLEDVSSRHVWSGEDSILSLYDAQVLVWVRCRTFPDPYRERAETSHVREPYMCGASCGLVCLVEVDLLPHDQFLASPGQWSRLSARVEYARGVSLAVNRRRTGGWRCGSGSGSLGTSSPVYLRASSFGHMVDR